AQPGRRAGCEHRACTVRAGRGAARAAPPACPGAREPGADQNDVPAGLPDLPSDFRGVARPSSTTALSFDWGRQMRSERTAETEALYAQGIELFRTAQWAEAVRVFSDLRAISSAYPEIDALIADAMLKIEIERTRMPEVAPPPRRLPAWVIGAVALALL